MSNDKVVSSLSNMYSTLEKKTVEVVKGQANFIMRLRKYTSNEDSSTINRALTFGIKLNIAIIIVEVLAIVFLDVYSSYGVMSKIASLAILLWLKNLFKEE